jgi:hypothetical protein
MKYRKKSKYLADGLLIVFSVLFALFIDKMYDNNKTFHRKEIALTNVKNEVFRNKEVIEEWHKNHVIILDRLNSLLGGKNDSLRNEIQKKEFLDFGLLLGEEGFMNEILFNTSWETIKSTGIIAEFDFDTTQQLTSVYLTQDWLVEKTLPKLADVLYIEAPSTQNTTRALVQLSILFNDLTHQENALIDNYIKALEKLK